MNRLQRRLQMLTGKRIGFGITASHCTYEEVVQQIEPLVSAGAEVIPIATQSVVNANTRFGTGEEWLKRIEQLTGHPVFTTFVEAEQLGPKNPLDCMVIAPMTGNSISKFANAATDSPVLMAAKATLRNGNPVVLGISTNDALGLNGQNLMKLLNAKNVYFIPFGQDDPINKPTSMIADFDKTLETVDFILTHKKQIQPIIIQYFK